MKMQAKRQNLSAKKSRAVVALLEEKTLKRAAAKAGIAEVTIFRWLQDQIFQQTYRDAKRRIVEHAITSLQKASQEAVETLREIMIDPEKPTTSRVSAARTVLDMAIRGVELEDLISRIEDLEAKVTI